MRLLFRLSFFVLLAGLVTGLLLRRSLPARRMPLLLALSGLPWLIHVLYVLNRGMRSQTDLSWQLAIFAALSLLAAIVSYWLTFRLLRRRLDAAALFPILIGASYGLAPLLWFYYVLRGAGVVLDSIPNVWLYGSLLFMVAVLWSFSFGRGERGRRPALPNPFRRR